MAAQVQHVVDVHHQPADPVPTQQASASQQGSAASRDEQQRCRGITIMMFGAIHIVIGASYMVYQLARLLVVSTAYAGIWGGLYVVATGCIGIAAGKTHSQALIITLLVMSIISVIVAGILVPVFMTFDALLEDVYYSDSYYFIGTKYTEASVILGIMGLLGFSSSLTISILTCVDLCASKTPKDPPTQMEMLAPVGNSVPPAAQALNAASVQNANVTPTAPGRQDYSPQPWGESHVY